MGIQQAASRLLTKYGEAVLLTYESGGKIDPTTGDVIVPPTVVSVEGFGYLGRYMLEEIDGTAIRATDGRLTLERVSERPQVGWSALVDSILYRVMDVRPVRKSALDIIYICQLRRN